MVAVVRARAGVNRRAESPKVTVVVSGVAARVAGRAFAMCERCVPTAMPVIVERFVVVLEIGVVAGRVTAAAWVVVAVRATSVAVAVVVVVEPDVEVAVNSVVVAAAVTDIA